jgi:hypothetical protein
VFIPVAYQSTLHKYRLYDDFSRLVFLHAHREASALTNELPEESDQFRLRRAACLTNLKGSDGLILATTSVMRMSIPLDLSSRPFIPLPRFIRSRRPVPLLVPSLFSFLHVLRHLLGVYCTVLSAILLIIVLA